MEWAVHRTLPLPACAPLPPGAPAHACAASCVAAHPLSPLLAVGTNDAVLVFDTVSGACAAAARRAARPHFGVVVSRSCRVCVS